MTTVVDIRQQLALFAEDWSPEVGESVWHTRADTDRTAAYDASLLDG